ncbi:MAG: 3-deoxy-D-manno-octulosonic acid transferase [Candidatus Omnitrophica bacterium]|nr:3-deoxy-D-manno-octulosonic acid transferase [Candidatus Omnitrophota bacterium]
MTFVYDLFFLVFSIIYIPILLFKGKFHKDFAQRFGFLPSCVLGLDRPIWIHGVSVGEAMVAIKLAEKLKTVFPKKRLIISTTTRTGYETAKKGAGENVDGIFYFPVDISFVVSSVVRNIGPSIFIMVETEIWPNILYALKKYGAVSCVINGRISDRSFGRYNFIKPLISGVLKNVDMFCMQSQKDAERIESLGARKEKICITGNIKFDVALGAGKCQKYDKRSLLFGVNDEVIVAGSTHYPEETYVVEAYLKLKVKYPALKLILAPRHNARSLSIGKYLREKSLTFALLTDVLQNKAGAAGPFDCLLVDAIGYLKDLYPLATVVFIGGSLMKKGGQNPIEPALCKKPVVFGPHMFNFREVSEAFVKDGGAVRVKDKDELFIVLDRLLGDIKERSRMGENAFLAVQKNRGALDKTVECLRNVGISYL